MDHEKCFSGGNLCAIVNKELLKQFSFSPIKSLKPYFGVISVQIGYELFQSISQDNSLLKTERVTVSFLSQNFPLFLLYNRLINLIMQCVRYSFNGLFS